MRLGWSYVLLIYTDDNYGTQGANGIRKYGEMNGLCFSEEIQVKTTAPKSSEYYKDISRKMKSSRAKGIIYFGLENAGKFSTHYNGLLYNYNS